MTKPLVGVAAVIALLALAFSIIAPAAADKRDRRLNFRLLDKNEDDEQNNTLVDVGAEGFTVGDYFVLGADPVFTPDGTRQVGVVTGDCLVVHIDAQTFATTLECDATFALDRGGSLTAEGPVSVSSSGEESGRLAITGGTNQFRTAGGQIDIRPVQGGLLFRFEVIL
jgi:hypothetical protein